MSGEEMADGLVERVVEATVRDHIEALFSVPWDEVSERTKRIIGNQVRDTCERAVTATLARSSRPRRLQSDTGPERLLYNHDGSRDYVLRQVGWLGQTGAFYALDEDWKESERGGVAPLYFIAHSDERDPPTPGSEKA